MLNTAYHYLDIVPKGPDEGERGRSWVRAWRLPGVVSIRACTSSFSGWFSRSRSG